jgi:outer membrane receptor protein involved in Fe transport
MIPHQLIRICRVRAVLAGCALFSTTALFGQEALNPPKAAPGKAPEGETVTLSPFQVTATNDNGYIATNTLAGSRLNTELVNTPAAISVLTKDFLADIGALNINQAMEFAAGAGNDISGGAADGVGSSTGNNLVGREFNFQIRGYRNTTVTRDYFPTTMAADVFNIERIDIARGPNSLLFGIGGPGGIANVTPKRALLDRNVTETTVRTGSWNANRGSLDLNRRFLSGRAALRVNALFQEADGYKDFVQDDQKRVALALTAIVTKNTTLRIGSEFGKLEQNRARPWTAVDMVTDWRDQQGAHYFEYGTPHSPSPSGEENYTQTYSGSGNNLPSRSPLFPGLNGTAQGAFERRSAHVAFPVMFMTDGPLAGKLLYVGTNNANSGGRYYRMSYSGNFIVPGFNNNTFIEDESIYPRTGNIAGPGAMFFTDYYVLGGSIEHRFGRNLTVELAANRTYTDRRNQSPVGFANLAYALDVTTTLPTFTTSGAYNATLGGPTAAGATTAPGTLGYAATANQGVGTLNFNSTLVNPDLDKGIVFYTPSYSLPEQTVDDVRASLSYVLDLGWAGRHNLLAFAANSFSKSGSQGFTEANVHPNRPNAQFTSTDNFNGRVSHIDPFAPNLADRGVPDPWKNPLPDSIIYGAPTSGTINNTHQFRDGWVRTGYSKSTVDIDSMAIATHSSFLNESLYLTGGLRRDEVRIRNWLSSNVAGETPVQVNGEILGLRSPTSTQAQAENTYSVGLVYHLPVLRGVSVFGNKSTNFREQAGTTRFEDADLRPDLEIGALIGTGIDAGLKFRLLEGRIHASLGYFKVEQTNAVTGFDGNITNYVNAIWNTILNNGPSTTLGTDQNNPNGHRVGGSETKSQAADGFEFELTANPTRNWRVSLNVTKANNVASDLGNNLAAYVEKHRAEWMSKSSLGYNTNVAPMFLTNSGGVNTIGALVTGLDSLIGVIKAGEGVSEVNSRALNANLNTAYEFSRGPLRRLTIGGGVNYRGDQVIGIVPPTLANPVSQVFKGGDYYLVNGMLAYRFEVKKVNVKLQLNVQNALNNQDRQVLASSYNSFRPADDPFDLYRYFFEPRSYSLSATFSF